MRLCARGFFCALALAQAPVAPVAPVAPGAPGAEAEIEPEVWDGSTAQGIAELRARAEREDFAGAQALGLGLLAPTRFLRWRRDLGARAEWSAPLFDALEPAAAALGLAGPSPRMRAEVHFARGLALARAADLGGAHADFERAAELGGPGDLRRAGLYAAGTVALEAAEALRLAIPEVREAMGLPPLAAPAAGTAPGVSAAPASPGAPAAARTPGEPDALALARSAYESARATLVQRLRLDWRDEDTRANLEWIQRRLRELDQIESEREEAEPPEQQEEPSEDPSESQPGEDGEPSESEDGSEPQDAQEPGAEPEPGEPAEDAGEEPPAPEDSTAPEDSDEPTPAEAPEPEDPTSGAGEEQAEPPPAGEDAGAPPEPLAERYLTREEMRRLLDQLEAIEAEAEAVRAGLRRRSRENVEKDW